MKIKRLMAALGAAAVFLTPLAACSHLRSADANADSNQQEKAKAPSNVLPPGDRYNGNSGPGQ